VATRYVAGDRQADGSAARQSLGAACAFEIAAAHGSLMTRRWRTNKIENPGRENGASSLTVPAHVSPFPEMQTLPQEELPFSGICMLGEEPEFWRDGLFIWG
jgi:hypothetical protein